MTQEIKGELILPQRAQLQILHKQSILDFGVMTRDQKKIRRFAIKNCGEEILDATLSIAENWVTISPSRVSGLKKGEIQEIEVKAEPEDVNLGKQKLSLLINSNDLMEKIKRIYVMAHIQEPVGSIKLHPDVLELDNISPTKKTSIKIEVINTSGSTEEASVEVEIDPKDTWLSYEITGHKNQLFINLEINPTKLTTGSYKSTVNIRELFSPHALPLKLPISFTISEDEPRITSKLKDVSSKEKVGEFIRGLVYEETQEENNDILYTDQKTYSFKFTTFIIIGIVILIIAAVIFFLFSK